MLSCCRGEYNEPTRGKHMQAQKSRSTITPRSALALVFGVSALSMGCATFPENTAGNHNDCIMHKGLSLEIECVSEETVVQGQPIVFDLTLKNTGSGPINLPREPFIGMKWKYRSGLYDGFLPPEETSYVEDKSELVTLAPGESYRVRKEIKTRHFSNIRGGIGISEFRAAYNSANNVRSNSVPLWEGVLVSNTYGVNVIRPGQ